MVQWISELYYYYSLTFLLNGLNGVLQRQERLSET